jgi:rubrerythrin
MIQAEKIDTLESFLALSMLLEFESADRLTELAIHMREHNATELASLLDELASNSDKHASEIQELSEGHVLPELATLDLTWEGLEGPEVTAYESVTPQTRVNDMLQIALRNEIRGQEFYTRISLRSPDSKVRQLAADFAEEESEHVMLLQQRMDALTNQPAS